MEKVGVGERFSQLVLEVDVALRRCRAAIARGGGGHELVQAALALGQMLGYLEAISDLQPGEHANAVERARQMVGELESLRVELATRSRRLL